ncbi:ImmA/IrrE family metallo-endopeptidase [Solihabitans fulvus]|uniref:ImmA/IrrE family metallo-endopeptidase n=1 Tax=Solihabitans fulvus TaxID=1892852 RepID=UPI001661E45F|nr:ImmA/IrrE family metallo-endopeptidase [Solihabitans fulvus]
MHQRCIQQIERLRIGTPLDIGALCADLGRQRGRPIRLLPMPARAANPTGLWISSATADYVFYEEDTSFLHRDHIILHEIGHLMLNHTGAPALTEATARLLLPNIDPAVVRRVLGRSNYSEQDEQEAEMFASLILSKAGFRVDTRHIPVASEEISDVLNRLWSVLGSPQGIGSPEGIDSPQGTGSPEGD